nr:ribonuclease H-like domain-containing protein [Tanacetum cinerariifolium]
MEQYLTHTDYALWEVIMNGDAPAQIASIHGSAKTAIPSKTTAEKIRRRNELKAKNNTSSLNEAVNIAQNVFAVSLQGQAATSTYADDVMFSFFATQSNSPQLHNEDLEQIDTNDHEEMDLKLHVECYNCHRRGHFARECRAPRSQRNRNGDNTRRVLLVETPTNALVVTDEMGYDWSYQAEEGPHGLCSNGIFIFRLIQSKDKTGLGYDSQLNEKALCNKKDVFKSASNSSVNESEEDNNQASDRYKIGEGYHAVPPPYTRNLMPLKPNMSFAGLDASIFTSTIRETNKPIQAKINIVKSDESARKSVIEPHTYKQAKNRTNLVKLKSILLNQMKMLGNLLLNHTHISKLKIGEGYHAIPPPSTRNFMPSKLDLSFVGLDDSVFTSAIRETVRPNAPIIEDWESDSDDDCESRPLIEQNKPSQDKINIVKSDENARKSVIKLHTYKQDENLGKSQNSRIDKRDRNELITQKLGVGFEFKKKACFACGSIYHLIKDCNFYENKMVGKSMFNNEGKATGQREAKILVNDAKQSSPREAASTSTARYVNTGVTRPTRNGAQSSPNVFHKSHSLVRRTFQQRTTPKTYDLKETVNIVKGNPQYTLKDHRIFDSGYSRHMMGNKSFLTDYQEIDGGFVAFGGSPKGGKISRKDTGIFDDAYDDRDVGVEADTNNLDLSTVISLIPTIRVHKDHPKEQIIRDLNLLAQTRRMLNFSKKNSLEILQFKLQKVWTLVDLSNGKRAIGTKWVFRNKKDKRRIVIRNKTRLVAQGRTYEEGIDYDEGFAPVARIETIRIFLVYASFMRIYIFLTKFTRYKKPYMDFIKLLEPDNAQEIPNEFYRRTYFLLRTIASTPIEPNKTLIKDVEAKDVDVHLYRSMIGSLMYLTDSTFWWPVLDYSISEGVFDMFWTSAKVNTINDDVRLQALVDGKKVIVNKASIRRDLRLNDFEGTACLLNDDIFAGLARMGYEKPSQKRTFYKAFFSPQQKFLIHTILQCLSAKTTAWTEFSSTMASAIICLANN